MLFKALGRNYSYPTSLEDITFETFLNYLDNVIPIEPLEITKLKENYIEFLKIKENKNDKQRKEQLKENEAERFALFDIINEPVFYSSKVLTYFARTVSHFTGMEYSKIIGLEGKGMDVGQLEVMYYEILKALNIEEYNPNEIEEINFEGETYVLPEKFMQKSTVIEFVEAAQFEQKMKDLKDGHLRALIDICSVILRKKGEIYSEDVYYRNKENFQRLTMAQIVDVAFFLNQRSVKLNENFQVFMVAQQLLKLRQEAKS